jgi:hypothetical protein
MFRQNGLFLSAMAQRGKIAHHTLIESPDRWPKLF